MAAAKKRNFWEEGTVKRVANLKRHQPVMPAASVEKIEDLQPLYNVNEVAAYFKVNRYTIYHWKGVWIEAETDRPTRFTAQQIEDCRVRRKGNTPLSKRKHG